MSLHALAGHMAAKGRGPDSMLVHMTPDEVRSLQAMARAQGGEVTINPETGLPEAGFLSDTFKALAPMALGAFLGPAGFGLSAGMAAAATGGITALATGSLSRGLMAGMGAYGGAGLAEGLAGMGSSAVGAEALAAANASADPIASLAAAKDAAVATGAAAPTGFSAVTEGAKRAFTSPEGFKELGNTMGGMGKLAQTGLMAISPIMADQGVQTTTPRGSDTGYIRQKKFNPYTQQYTDLEPVKASEWGSRRFSDFADGGIVALADGGTPPTYDQNYVNQLVKEAATQAGGTLSYADAANAAKNLGISEDMLRSAASNTGFITGAPTPVAGPAAGTDAYNSMVGNWFNQYPNATAADISSAISTYGLNPQDVANAMRASGLSNAAQYAAFQPDVGVPIAPQGGLAGLTSNINDWLSSYPNAKREEAERAMGLWGYNEADIIRATGRTLDELFKEQKKPIMPGPINTVTNLPGGIGGGGNTVVNPNGTITTAPNIPGRPAGGFTGMGQVRDVYTQGGGSLGQSNLFVPKTIDEMYARYGNTGGSQQAYDYLMGKGSVDIKKPVTASGELMLPYTQAVLGQETAAANATATQKYLFDPKTRKYILNPAYVDPNAPKEPAPTPTPAQEEPGTRGYALGGLSALAEGGQAQYNLGGYSDGGRLLRGPGDGVSDSIPATIGNKQPARLADGEFVVPARIVSELGNGSTEAGARKLYAMMDRVQKARGKTTGKNRVATNTRSDKYLPA